jgi:hypothetical protein
VQAFFIFEIAGVARLITKTTSLDSPPVYLLRPQVRFGKFSPKRNNTLFNMVAALVRNVGVSDK